MDFRRVVNKSLVILGVIFLALFGSIRPFQPYWVDTTGRLPAEFLQQLNKASSGPNFAIYGVFVNKGDGGPDVLKHMSIGRPYLTVNAGANSLFFVAEVNKNGKIVAFCYSQRGIRGHMSGRADSAFYYLHMKDDDSQATFTRFISLINSDEVFYINLPEEIPTELRHIEDLERTWTITSDDLRQGSVELATNDMLSPEWSQRTILINGDTNFVVSEWFKRGGYCHYCLRLYTGVVYDIDGRKIELVRDKDVYTIRHVP